MSRAVFPTRQQVSYPSRQAGTERFPVWNRLDQNSVTLTDPNSIIVAGWTIDAQGFLSFTTSAVNTGQFSGGTRTGASFTVQVPAAIDHDQEYMAQWLHVTTFAGAGSASHRVTTMLRSDLTATAIYTCHGVKWDGANRATSRASSSAAEGTPGGATMNFTTRLFVTSTNAGTPGAARLRDFVGRWYIDPTVGDPNPSGSVDAEDITGPNLGVDQPFVGIGVSAPAAGAWSAVAALYWAVMPKHSAFAL